jgi:predicted DNA binding CopG/RHH family protein
MKNKIPKFKNEAEEQAFWARRDSTNYVDWRNAKKVISPELKPTLRTISLRLPESMLAQLKVLAHQRDVPYQSLMKIFLAEKIEGERKNKNL